MSPPLAVSLKVFPLRNMHHLKEGHCGTRSMEEAAVSQSGSLGRH